jgi:outer membrane lipoprotein SlyB
MKPKANLILAVLVAAWLPACAVTTAEYGGAPPGGAWVLYGQVESVRQHYEHVQGDPGQGAVAGAIIGGVLGTALGGRGFGTLVGATEGAMIGANASTGSYAGQVFDVYVRFDDGSRRVFAYRDQLPFRPGDYVTWTEQGLFHR